MNLHPRSAILATALAGSAWLLAATLVQAAPAPPPALVQEPADPDAAPRLAISVAAPSCEGDAAGTGTSAGGAEVQIPAIRPVDPGKWTFALTPYLWLAGVKSTATFAPPGTGGVINADADVDFSDLLKHLNFGLMGSAEARRGPFSLQADVLYINLLQDGSGVRTVTGPLGRLEVPINVGGKLKLKTAVGTFDAGYDIFRNDRGFVELFGGVRYLALRSTLDWNFQGPTGNFARAGTVKSQADIWNGVAGLRGEHALGDGPWKAIYYIDVGAGDSNLTWEGQAQVAYAKRWGDIGLGWRYLEFDQGSDRTTANLKMSGPIISVRFQFR